MKLHEKIYYYRKKAGLSQDALAEKLGVSRQAISKWETAESVPETAKLAALASALGISVDWLLSEEEPEGETNGAREYDAGTFVPGRDASSAGTAARSRTRGLKHWAWLSGVAIAVIGAYLLYQAVTAKLAMSSLLGLLNMDGYIGGETVWVNGVETPIVDFLQNNPVSVVSTVWLIVGAVLVLGGIALAVFLKRKFRT